MSLSHNAKNLLRRLLVYVKYLLPGITCGFVWLFCIMKIWRFSNGDGTTRVYQSLIGLIGTVKSSCETTLASSQASSADSALANSLKPTYWIFLAVLIVVTVLSAILFFFSIAGLAKDPLSDEANRTKVWFRCFFPGRIVHMLLPILTAVPLYLPYYIVDRFTKYYSASGATEGDYGTTFSYYEYSVSVKGINPVVFVTILAGLCLLTFIGAIPFERSQKLDMYTNFEK